MTLRNEVSTHTHNIWYGMNGTKEPTINENEKYSIMQSQCGNLIYIFHFEKDFVVCGSIRRLLLYSQCAHINANSLIPNLKCVIFLGSKARMACVI